MTEHIRVPTPEFGQASKVAKYSIGGNTELDNDPVNHPQHYTDHPSGVECITITEHMNFNVGNAVKYLWRSGSKGSQVQDLEKAAWYVNREIERLKRNA